MEALTPPKDLRITLVQTSLVWENKEENLQRFDRLLQSDHLKGKTDLIVLPEMFTTGFTMNAHVVAETMDDKTVAWMQKKASELDAVITGSVVIKENERYFNRLLWVTPSGEVGRYDKRHLFTMADEHHYFSAGIERRIFSLKGWRILPLICYDLRFPAWSRNVDFKPTTNDYAFYDVLMYVANWPEVRRDPWQKLLLARAIENQAYVVGVNRIGNDEKGIHYAGDSALIAPYGSYQMQCRAYEEHVTTTVLKYDELAAFRKKFPVLNDADRLDLC